MPRKRNVQPPAPGGFTLIELLVVMGIICILVSLLIPAVTAAFVASRRAATANRISQISNALEAFKTDWGIYPPSDNTHESPPNPASDHSNWPTYGYQTLAYYLLGTTGQGWGATYNNYGPFGGTAYQTYGPYYDPTGCTLGTAGYIPDAFTPVQPIYYYRYEPTATNPFEVTNNGPGDSNAITNFPGGAAAGQPQTQFEFLVRPTSATGASRWVREDYLLISCGADRYWGYMKDDLNNPGRVIPMATSDTLGNIDVYCDDVTNFPH